MSSASNYSLLGSSASVGPVTWLTTASDLSTSVAAPAAVPAITAFKIPLALSRIPREERFPAERDVDPLADFAPERAVDRLIDFDGVAFLADLFVAR